MIVIGLASILASWAYSAGPFPFGRHGFADPLFFLFFGIVSVLGAYYVQAELTLGPAHWREALPWTAVAASLPIGALITNILIIDDICDCAFDAVNGKNTVAVRFGKCASRAEFSLLLAFAYLAPFWFWHGLHFSGWVLLPLVTAPLALIVLPERVGEGSLRRARTDDAAPSHADGSLRALPGDRAGGVWLIDTL